MHVKVCMSVQCFVEICEMIILFTCSCRGYKRFFRRNLLESSEFLKNDCLKINCTVGVVVSATDCPLLNSIHVPESDIGSHFGTLLENMEGSDVTFDVAGERFPGHKIVLAARSPEFRSKFLNGMDVDTDKQEIVVTDLEPKVFKVKTIYFLLFFLPFHYLLSMVVLSMARIYYVIMRFFLLNFSFVDKNTL